MNTPFFFSKIINFNAANQNTIVPVEIVDIDKQFYIQKIGVICTDVNGVAKDNTVAIRLEFDNKNLTNDYIHSDLIAANSKVSQLFLPELIIQKSTGLLKIHVKNLRQDATEYNFQIVVIGNLDKK